VAIEPIMSNTMAVAAKFLSPILPQKGHNERKHKKTQRNTY
jgi:hypothetical protein